VCLSCSFQKVQILGSLAIVGKIGELIIAMLRSGKDLDGLNFSNFAMLFYSSYWSIIRNKLMLKHKNAIVKQMIMHTKQNLLTE